MKAAKVGWLGDNKFARWMSILAIFLTTSSPSPAVILYSTGDPTVNTTAPTGILAGSGWQFVGNWQGFLGTVISANCFITAYHVGGNVGDPFTFNGVNYTVAQTYEDPTSDLRIWRVCGTFTDFAPLYTAQTELNKSLVVIGRGTQRGAEVRVNNALKGWMWGQYDGVTRWGQNKVSQLLLEGTPNYPTGVRGGDFLRATFDANGGANEAHLSTGDSGGPVFIQLNGVWSLAGVNFSVDGPFNTTDTGPGFNAAIFNTGGLYETQDGTTWTQSPDLLIDTPSGFYATRISTRLTWIQQVLNSASGQGTLPVLESAAQPQGGFTEETTATLNTQTKQFTVNASGSERFYRLRSCSALRITGISVNSGQVVIRYQ